VNNRTEPADAAVCASFQLFLTSGCRSSHRNLSSGSVIVQISTDELCLLGSAASYSSRRRLPSASRPRNEYLPRGSGVLVEVGARRGWFPSRSWRRPSRESAGKADRDGSPPVLQGQSAGLPQPASSAHRKASVWREMFSDSAVLL